SPAPINATPLAQIKRNYARGTSSPVKIVPTPVPPPIKRPPLPAEPFWSPSVPKTPPACLEASAWQELVANSVIHPAIAQLNFRSLKEDSIEKTHEAWEYLFYSAKLDRTNTGQLVSGILKRYRHIENGGWWCGAGVDPLSFSNLKPGEQPAEKLWGCFKPNTPRVDRDKPEKIIKYEHPLKTQRSIFLLHVPDSIAERIFQKEQIHPSPDDRQRGFWYCAWKYNLPITITEGAKKAACLLSQCHAAIGLPGIYAGYSSKDERGYPIVPHLHEELAVFATPGRQVTFCFDYETKAKTIRNINIAIARTSSLLQSQGCTVSKVILPGPEKGVDDLILARGPLFYERQYRTAKTLPIFYDNVSKGAHCDRRNNTTITGGVRAVAEDEIAAAPNLADTSEQLQIEALSTSNPGFGESNPKQEQRLLVKINTSNPLLQQYNGKIGEVLQQIKLGRMEQTIVKIGSVTPTFSPSDLEPVPAGSKSNERQDRNALPAELSTPVQLQSTPDPISDNPHHELIASQQPPTTHSTDIGKRTSKIFHSNSHPAQPAPNTSRTNRDKSASASRSVETGPDVVGTRETEFIKHHERAAKDRQAKANRNSPGTGKAASDRFGAIDTSIERRERLRSLVNSVRTIPLEAVLQCLGLEYDRATRMWNGGGCAIAIDGKEFTDRLADKTGRGAVALVAQVRATSLKESLKWLSDSLAVLQSHSLQSEATAKQISNSTAEPSQIAEETSAFQSPTHSVPLSERASDQQYDPQTLIATDLLQLSDRELLNLEREVRNYLDHQPRRPPADLGRSLQDEINSLDEQLGRLWQQQARQISIIESLRNQLFHSFNSEYREAYKCMENIAKEIDRASTLRQQKERLLQDYCQLESTYLEWLNNPQTVKLQGLRRDLNSPQLQKRIANIRFQLQKQEQALRRDWNKGLSL
ncbi:hypothetical protein C7B80_25050, partial [Cyanosarcina cf. burmensis CCALA 770]